MSIAYPNINFIKWWNFQKHGFNRTDLKLADLLCEKHNFYIDEQHIQIIARSNGGRRRKQSATKTVQKCIFPEIFLPRYLLNGDWYRRSLRWKCTLHGGEQHIQILFWSNSRRWNYSYQIFFHQYVFSPASP